MVAVALLLAIGVFLRFYGLSEHFAQFDDLFPIAGPYVMNQGRPKVVPIPYTNGRWSITVDTRSIKTNPILYAAYVSTATYAPLQFLAFPLVLHGDYRYREFLWRGRLPSAVCASLALFVFGALYRSLSGGIDAGLLVGLCAFSLSLMNITYAQQSISYSIGGLAAGMLLLMLMSYARRTPSTKRLLWWTLPAALLAYANYQVGVTVGLAYGALAVTEFVSWGETVKDIAGRYARAGLAYVALVLPLAVPLHDKTAGVGQFAGVAGFDAFFPHAPAGSLLDRGTYAVTYGARALYRVVETDVTFALNDPAASACVAILFGFFMIGVVVLMRDRSPAGRAVVLFLAGLVVMLSTLNAIGRFPLAPSRHVLVFTPAICLLIGIGGDRLRRTLPGGVIGDATIGLFLAVMLTVFARDYGHFREERRDRFDSAAMEQALTTYGVDTIVGYASTWNPALMFRDSPRLVAFIDLDAIIRKGSASVVSIPDRSFLLVSQHLPIDRYPSRYPRESNVMQWPHHKITQLVRIDSDVEPGISNAIKIGTNGFYLSLATYVGGR